MNPRRDARSDRADRPAARRARLIVIVIEHDMRVVKGVSDRVIALDYGRKIAEGTTRRFANDEQVIEAYLGPKAVGRGPTGSPARPRRRRRVDVPPPRPVDSRGPVDVGPSRSSSCGRQHPLRPGGGAAQRERPDLCRARWSVSSGATPAGRPPRCRRSWAGQAQRGRGACWTASGGEPASRPTEIVARRSHHGPGEPPALPADDGEENLELGVQPQAASTSSGDLERCSSCSPG